MSKAISNSADILDSRDIIERIKELETLRDDAQEAKDGDKETMEDGTELYTSVDFQEDEYVELTSLLALQEEAGSSPDWIHGEALIRDTYFESYAQELAEDTGMTKEMENWPYNCIDWEKASDMLKQDYMSVDFDGEEYWIRA